MKAKEHVPELIELYRDSYKKNYQGCADVTIFNNRSVQYVFGDKVINKSRVSFDTLVEFGQIVIVK